MRAYCNTFGRGQSKTMTRGGVLSVAIALTVAVFAQTLFFPVSANAQEKIRIGIIAPLSGPFATAGRQFRSGVEAFQTTNGKTAGGREVEVVYRDTAGADPAVARRLAEELIVREKVSLIGGTYLAPDGVAIAPVLTETKTPGVVFLAGIGNFASLSPYLFRTGTNSETYARVMADWGIKNGFKRAYVTVSDFSSGWDLQAAVEARVMSAGGTILGRDRMPLNTVDYSPFAERVANAKPDVVHMFVPPGAPMQQYMKAMVTQGVVASKIPIIGSAVADDPDLTFLGDPVLGLYSINFYSPDVPGEANQKFKAALEKNSPGAVPNYAMVGAFDGMHVLYSMIESQKGKTFDGTSAIEAIKGVSWASPRGPVTMDRAGRELIQNLYIRQVQKINGRLTNVTIDTFQNVSLR